MATKKDAKPPPEKAADGATPTDGDATATNGHAATASEANGTGPDPRKPVHVMSYLVARDTFIQASIWARQVTLADGTGYTTHDVSLRKRVRGDDDEWMSYYSFRGSELYAVAHAVSQANAWILERRAANDCPF